jgi:CubicO group peptidase (beta-lactamase class C family)
MIRWTMTLLCVVLLTGPAAAQKGTAKVSKKALQAILEQARKKYDVPALGVAVVSTRGVDVLAVAGTRKRGAAVPVQETDRFHLGSDTKALTATLIALLVQKKELRYDLTLDRAFPDLAGKMPAELRKATLLQVLTHRAGLKANLDWWSIPGKLPSEQQRRKAVELALAAKPESAPGTKFHYSNLGYVVAAALAERVAKQSWERLLQQHLAKPLKMTTLGYGPMGTPGKIDQPWQHDKDGKPVAPDPSADNPPVIGPAGRAHCSLGDWGRFVADQLRGAAGKGGLLRPAAYRKMHEPAKPGEEYTPGGWLYVRTPRGGELTHDGSNTMNYCSAWLVPRRGLAVLVVCNQGGDKGEKAVHEVRDEVLRRLLGG